MRTFRYLAAGMALTALAACADRPTEPAIAIPQDAELSRISKPDKDKKEKGQPIPDQYIVVLKPSAGAAAASARAMARHVEAEPLHVYESVLTGFAAKLTPAQVRRLQRDPSVDYIVQDAVVTTQQQKAPSSFITLASEVTPTAVQLGATWGIDRTDQRGLPLDGGYRYFQTGAGVNAYVLDTGIRTAHTQFGGRAFAGASGFDAIGDGQNGQDCNGHGTHVAGTIGGSTYGIAKLARLYSVRVLDCGGFGSWSGVIAGLDWITNRHVKPAVVNASLGGPANAAVDAAVRKLIEYGVTFVAAAGNSNADACTSTPARVTQGITVGATTSTDARAAFSNFGSCLTLFAPGQNITSAWSTSNVAINTISGTSMAAPHVAGKAALFLQRNPTAAPALVKDVLVSDATVGIVSGAGAGSPNRLLNRWNFRLTAAGTSRYEPHGSFYSAAAGWHHGWLSGSGTDFDLYLERWVCNPACAWSTVAFGVGLTSSEYVVYNGPAGSYRWRVHAYSGTGDYDLFVRKP